MGQTKKRLASLLVILMVLFAGHTLAEGKSYIPCNCLFGKCTCFIQNGDEGGAEKMNYECLGNGKGGAHIHWHLFPRKTGDLGEYGNKGKGPAWWYPMEKDVRRFRKARRRRIDKDETAITQRTGYSVINFQKQAGNKKYGEGI